MGHSATRKVVKDMGQYALQFFEFTEGYKSYTYPRSKRERYFKCHKKWKSFFPSMRGRKYAAMLTEEYASTTGKSGSSYNIIGLFCIFDSLEDVQMANETYWELIQEADASEDKLELTKAFATWLKEQFESAGGSTYVMAPTYKYLMEIEQ